MIEFKGELTGESRNFLLKKQVKIQTTTSLFVMVLFGIPTVFAAIFWNPLALLFFIAWGLLLFFSMLTPSKKDQKSFMPKRIYIDLEEGTIVHECEKMERFHMISDVKEVVDYGEWYYVIFVYESRDMYFVCEKSLITQGTIEEFEALFEGKIVKAENI